MWSNGRTAWVSNAALLAAWLSTCSGSVVARGCVLALQQDNGHLLHCNDIVALILVYMYCVMSGVAVLQVTIRLGTP